VRHDFGKHDKSDKRRPIKAIRAAAAHRLEGGRTAELLVRPCLVYIDEATSGLDAGTETRMMSLFRKLAGSPGPGDSVPPQRPIAR